MTLMVTGHKMAGSGVRQLFGAEAQDKVLSDTAQQVNEQLSIVSKLRHQNSPFLNQSERDWIDNVARNAVGIVERLTSFDQPVVERPSPPLQRLKNPAILQQVRSLIKNSPSATTELTQLLIAAQSLNSAISLLSCCYDRYRWTQTGEIGIETDVSDSSKRELSQLLNRRKPIAEERVAQVVKLASVCIRGQRPVIVHHRAKSSENVPQSPPPLDDAASNYSEPEGLLSAMVVESIEQWQQNAVLALEMASKRFTNVSPTDISRDHDSSSQRSVHNENQANSDRDRMKTSKQQSSAQENPLASAAYDASAKLDDAIHKGSSVTPNLKSQHSISRKPIASFGQRPYQAVPSPGLFRPSVSDCSVTNTASETSVPNGTNEFHSSSNVSSISTNTVHRSPKDIGYRSDSSFQPTLFYCELPGSTIEAHQKSPPQIVSNPSLSSVSQCSSEPNASHRNESDISKAHESQKLGPISPLLKPVRMSRGRAWLERQAEMNA